MMNTLKQLIAQHKSMLLYLFFGGCTTLVNLAAYYLCAHPLGMPTLVSTVAAWAASVLFAYVTNRTWVFDSQARTASELLREMARFFGFRLATGGADWVCMFLFVELLHLNDMVIKVAANVLVIVLNYAASKLLIFNKGEQPT